jgi:mannose-6-phosphate isomerase-like protein (cupin superfamily)
VATTRHCHGRSEEIYHFLAGHGVMTLGNQRFPVKPGDSVCIPPGTPHCLHNDGSETLVLLCCCAPPYAHGDTDLLT